MKRYFTIIILFLLFIAVIPIRDVYTDSEYIERKEIPKDLGLNVLEIYNYKDKPLFFFDGYHQKGVIYLGDFADIQSLYDYSSLDFILVQRNSTQSQKSNLLYTSQIINVELQDDDNSLSVIDEDTVMLELKRFKFIISNELNIDEIKKYDAQFFVLINSDDIHEIQNTFSVEQIFLVGDYPDDNNNIISVIPKKYYIQFICNHSSYKYKYNQY